MTGQVVAFRDPRTADSREALIAAIVPLHTLITLDPFLGASPVRVYFVLNPQAIGRIVTCLGPEERAQARFASAFALVAYDFPFAVHLIASTAPTIARERGKEIATCSADLLGDALQAAASAFDIDAQPAFAFDATELKSTFFPSTQESVTHVFRLTLRKGGGEPFNAVSR